MPEIIFDDLSIRIVRGDQDVSLFQYIYGAVDELAGRVLHCIRDNWTPSEIYLSSNPLSRYWNRSAFNEDGSRIVGFSLLYILGMAGYALSLPFRVFILAKEILHLFVGTVTGIKNGNFSEQMRVRVLCVTGAIGEVVAATVGVVCPPAGYYLDEQINRYSEIRHNLAGAGSFVHTRHSASLESSSLEPLPLPDQSDLQIIQSLPLQAAFQLVIAYYKPQELVYDHVRRQIALIAFLLDFDEKLADDPNVKFCLGNPDHWESMTAQFDPAAILQFLKLKAVKDCVLEEGEGEALDSRSFKPGQEEALEEALLGFDFEADFEALYQEFLLKSDHVANCSNASRHLWGLMSQVAGSESTS